MSAYLKFFELDHSPFDTGPRSALVLGTQALRDAFAQIENGLGEDAPRICVSGGSGLGKTSLARALPKLLRGRARVVLLMNPSLPWATLRGAIVRQLDLEDGVLSRQTLLARRSEGQQIVLVVDAAEQIGHETLEHLDILLGYRTDDDEQLVHGVLLANLDHAREQSECPLLWWLDSLHTLQLEFAPIPAKGVHSYIIKHLKRAGWKGGELFTQDATQAIHRLTGGVPRAVSELCERVLEHAAECGAPRIDAVLVEVVCGERPAAAPGAETGSDAEPEEMLLDTVVPSEPVTRPAEITLEEPVPLTDPVTTDAVSPAEGAPRAPVRNTGLDAFFGPAETAPERMAAAVAPADRAETLTPIAPASIPFADASEDPAEWAEPDVESRGGMLRAVAIAAGVLVVLIVGLLATGLLGGDESEHAPAGIEQGLDTAAGRVVGEVADAAAPPGGTARTGERPGAVEGDAGRVDISRSLRPDGTPNDGAPSSPLQAKLSGEPGRASAAAARVEADGDTEDATVQPSDTLVTSTRPSPDEAGEAKAPDDQPPGGERAPEPTTESSVPASPAPYGPGDDDDRMERAAGRHD